MSFATINIAKLTMWILQTVKESKYSYKIQLVLVPWMIPVSYTHLDVYKRQHWYQTWILMLGKNFWSYTHVTIYGWKVWILGIWISFWALILQNDVEDQEDKWGIKIFWREEKFMENLSGEAKVRGHILRNLNLVNILSGKWWTVGNAWTQLAYMNQIIDDVDCGNNLDGEETYLRYRTLSKATKQLLGTWLPFGGFQDISHEVEPI